MKDLALVVLGAVLALGSGVLVEFVHERRVVRRGARLLLLELAENEAMLQILARPGKVAAEFRVRRAAWDALAPMIAGRDFEVAKHLAAVYGASFNLIEISKTNEALGKTLTSENIVTVARECERAREILGPLCVSPVQWFARLRWDPPPSKHG